MNNTLEEEIYTFVELTPAELEQVAGARFGGEINPLPWIMRPLPWVVNG